SDHNFRENLNECSGACKCKNKERKPGKRRGKVRERDNKRNPHTGTPGAVKEVKEVTLESTPWLHFHIHRTSAFSVRLYIIGKRAHHVHHFVVYKKSRKPKRSKRKK